MTDNRDELLNLFFERRSIRKFRKRPINKADVLKIVETGQRAPSACNLQTYSIIWARDQKTREKVLDACEVTDPIRDVPIVLIICADIRRLARTLDYLKAGHDLGNPSGNYSIRIMSIMDASFAAENMVMTAECLGLSSVFIGSAAANRGLIEALKLPQGVLPLTLLCVGYADEEPPTRPRLPMSTVLHVDVYRDASRSQMKSFLKHMDDSLSKEGYYQKYGGRRRPDFRYSNHVQHKTAPRFMKKIDDEMKPVLKKWGLVQGKIA